MEKRDRNYVVAGNNKTFLSLGGYTNQEENDHEEADTLIIRCLRLVDDFIENKIVNVYSADTDVFLLLFSHSNKINCQCLYIHLVKGKVDIKLVCQKLGNETSKALLSLHGLTGCDTTGKFEGKSKQFWFRRFLTIDQNNSKLKKELADFQESNESTDEIESFFCRGYLYSSNKDAQKRVHETAALNTTRYSLFTKKQFEGEKLPPTKSAFEYHLLRAFFQVTIWSSATDALINHLLDPLEFGWEFEEGILVGRMTSRNIAPSEVVELVACKCSKGNLSLKLYTEYPGGLSSLIFKCVCVCVGGELF